MIHDEADCDQIEMLINNQCYTMWELGDILKISKPIKLLMKMKKCVFCFMERNQTNFLANPIQMHVHQSRGDADTCLHTSTLSHRTHAQS